MTERIAIEHLTDTGCKTLLLPDRVTLTSARVSPFNFDRADRDLPVKLTAWLRQHFAGWPESEIEFWVEYLMDTDFPSHADGRGPNQRRGGDAFYDWLGVGEGF